MIVSLNACILSVAREYNGVFCKFPITNFCLRLPTVRGTSAAGVTVKLEP